jgi:hypothetical protein
MNISSVEHVYRQAVASGSFTLHQTSLVVCQVSEIALSAIQLITDSIVNLSTFAITVIKANFGYVPAPIPQVLVIPVVTQAPTPNVMDLIVVAPRPDLYALFAYYHSDRLPISSDPALACAVADLQLRVSYYIQRNTRLASSAYLDAPTSRAIVIQDCKALHAKKEAEQAAEALAFAIVMAASAVGFAIIAKDTKDKKANAVALMAMGIVFIALSEFIMAEQNATPYSLPSDIALSEAEASATRGVAALFASFAALALSSSLFATCDAGARSARALVGIARAARDIFDLTDDMTPTQAIPNRITLALGWY